VEWLPGTNDEDSYAIAIARPDHWDLVDCIAVTTAEHKTTGSTRGHELAGTSPLQAARVLDAPKRLAVCREAILKRDFKAFAAVTELDSNLMHAVMMTSNPILLYWLPATINIMRQIPAWRAQGFPVCYTIDAGPNVHVLTLTAHSAEISRKLSEIPGVQKVLQAPAGGPARLITPPDE
jgi:diphosphomevalonate decarboxylase